MRRGISEIDLIAKGCRSAGRIATASGILSLFMSAMSDQRHAALKKPKSKSIQIWLSPENNKPVRSKSDRTSCGLPVPDTFKQFEYCIGSKAKERPPAFLASTRTRPASTYSFV